VAKTMYCPSWRHPFFQYDKVASGIPAAVGYGGWPAPGHPVPPAHTGISYMYRSTFNPGANQPPSHTVTNDRPAAFIADHWYTWIRDNITYGYLYGHRAGYNAVYLDNHVSWKPDSTAQMLNNPVMNQMWAAQEVRWQSFFDE
jgi:hypothetical protein